MSIAKNILNAEYRLVRSPIRAVERRFLHRLPEESLLRLGAEGGLGAFDAVAGRVTGDETVREQGNAMIDAVKASYRARTDARVADHLQSRAERERARLQESAAEQRREAHHDVASAVDDTVGEVVQRKTEAAFSAAKTAASKASDVVDRAKRKSAQGVEEVRRSRRTR